LGYAGGYQAGLIAVLILANRVEGGVAAYQWAFTFFYLPHALVGVPLFNVLFTAFSEHAARQEVAKLGERMRQGLRMLFFILIPLAGACVILGPAAARIALEHGAMSREGSLLVGRALAMFGLGLPAYSAFLVMTRAFYALGNAKTPALLNGVTIVLTMLAGVLGFFGAPNGWEVAGLAAGHSIGFLVGAGLLGRSLGKQVGTIFDRPTWTAIGAALAGASAATLAMWVPVKFVAGDSVGVELLRLILGVIAGALVYAFVMWRAGSDEAARLWALLRGASVKAAS
jgi:putative peptidoglycan lipid II flippase